MTDIIVLICAFAAGALLYLAGREDFEEMLSINIQKNILFPIFMIIIILLGIYVAGNIHLSEVAIKNSSPQQPISIMTCLFENQVECETKANIANNETYQKFQAGTATYEKFYIPFSMNTEIVNNPFTYFCGGVLFIWAFILFTFLGVKKDGS